MADEKTRKARKRAHEAFDPLWRAKMMRDRVDHAEARNAGYAWLAIQLGLSDEDCHIGMMSAAQCQQVIDVCRRFHVESERKRA